MLTRLMKFVHTQLSGLKNPGRSAVKYTITGLVLSLFLSLLSIFMIWFSNTPIFDIRPFLKELADQILTFRLSIMLILVGVTISWAILKRKTSTTLACAVLIKLITGSYMTALITTGISRFMVQTGYFGVWAEDYLPWSSMYPTIALPMTILLWGGTWWGVLVLRNHVKALARDAGTEHSDIYDRLGAFFNRELDKRTFNRKGG